MRIKQSKGTFASGGNQFALKKRNSEGMLDHIELTIGLHKAISNIDGATCRRLCTNSNSHKIEDGVITMTRRYGVWMADKKLSDKIIQCFLCEPTPFSLAKKHYSVQVTKALKHFEMSSICDTCSDEEGLIVYMLVDVSFRIVAPKDLYTGNEEQI